MTTRINLEDLYSNVMPYLSDPIRIKEFFDGLESTELDRDGLVKAVEVQLQIAEGTLRTDFRIILNTINQF